MPKLDPKTQLPEEDEPTKKFRVTSGRVELIKEVGEVVHLAISFQTKDRYWHQVKVKINQKHFKQM